MTDTFKNVANRQNPADRWFELDASETALAIIPRGIKCTVAGAITIEDVDGNEMDIPSGASIGEHAVRPNKVTALAGTWYGLY